ncbi:MAG: Zn-binding domain-containing protein, partial [Planctomycetota bacterium]
ITCDTLSFSHSVGCVNAPWQTIFIYERHPLGLGFTRRAYELLGRIMPAVLDNVRNCPCQEGCPCCVGKPLRQYATWNVERGEASIPSKQAALMILERLLGDGSGLTCPDTHSISDSRQAEVLHLRQALRRRLERMREPEVFHPIDPDVKTGYPEVEDAAALDTPDVSRRLERRQGFQVDLRKRLAKRLGLGGLSPTAGGPPAPPGMSTRRGNLTPKAFPGKPAAKQEAPSAPPPPEETIALGDSLAAKARRIKKKRKKES